jgi:phosphate starvation-inducible PhoH-like protein
MTSYVQAKTKNHKEYILSIINNTITVCVGEPGLGKSYIPIGLALEHIERNDKPQNQLIITRPLVAVGKDIGSLPGTIDERIFPYFRPVYFNILKMLKSEARLKKMITDRQIMFEPLELMRGMTYDKAFIIVDEAQDTTPEQMLMVLTRLGDDSKIIVNGDLGQSDIRGVNGLHKCLDSFEHSDYASIIELGPEDQQRNALINRIVKDFGQVKLQG